MHLLARLTFACVLAAIAGSLADAQPEPMLTLEQKEKLKERNRLINHAIELMRKGKLLEARDTGRKCLAIEVEIYGENHPEMATLLDWLTDLSLQAEDYSGAKEVAQRALAVCKKLYGESHWKTTDARLKLADVELRSSMSKEQKADLAKADQLKREYGEKKSRGEYQKAIELAEKATSLFKAALGVKHPDYATSLNNLAYLYKAQGQYAKAEPLYLEALAIDKEILGVKHPDYATSLNNLAALYDSQGQFAKAEPLYLEALAIRKEVLGVKHPDYATSLNNLADLYDSQGQYAKAEPLYLEALAIRKEVLGVKHPDYAQSLNNLAGLYKSQGQYAKAEPLYLEALAIRKEVLGVKHPSYATSLNNLAFLYRSQGQYARAEPLLREALAIVKEVLGVKHPTYATSLNNLAALYDSQGQYAKAEPLLREALAIDKEVLGVKHPDYALSLNNLANLYVSQGQYAKAEPLYLESLAIKKEVLGVKHPDYATSLNNLANLYRSQGQYAKAEPLYLESLAIKKEVLGVKHPDYATSLNNLASLYESQGQYAKAEPLYLEAMAIRKEALGVKHPDYALSLNNLANLYVSQGQYAKAEPLYLESLAIKKEVLGVKHPDYALSLNNLASLYESHGQYAKAEPLYLEALAVNKEALGVKHPDYATSLNNLAFLYDSQGQHAKAEPLYLEALAIRKEVLGLKHPTYASSLNNLAFLYRSQGQYARAEPLYQEAIRIIEEHLEETAASQSEFGQLAYVASTRFHLNNLLYLKDTAPSRIYATALRWRSAVTARQAFSRAFLRALSKTAGEDVSKLVAELRGVSLELALLVASPPKGVNVPARYKQLEKQRDELEKRLANQSKDFARYLEYRQLTPTDLQKALPPDAVLIDFLAYGDQVAAFIITPKTITRVDLKGGQELAEMVREFRSELSLKRQRPVSGEADDSRLYNTVWAPLLPHIGNAKLVLICPDGPLCQLPFAALRGSDPKKYLIEEVALAVIPVPRMLPEILASDAAKPNTAKGLLAMGDVDFGLGRWKALPGTKQEIEVIEKLFRQTVPGGTYEALTGKKATHAALRAAAGKYRYLHLATHGFFLAPLPQPKLAESRGDMSFEERAKIPQINPGLLCGLVCAGANNPSPQEDGNFTALEIMDLDLGGVELAVLSACETGLGEIKAGDGVLGLQRAFQLAGARTTVTSLWQVPDAATSALMIRFYDNRLKKGMPVLEALREAQLWVLNHGVEAGILTEVKNGRRTPPLYWAAFTLAGDWR